MLRGMIRENPWLIALLLALLVAWFKGRRSTHDHGYIYFVESADKTAVKIGMTRLPNASRATDLIRQAQPGTELLFIVPVTDPQVAEKKLHRMLADYRIGGEWFEAAKAREVIATIERAGLE